MRRCLVIGCGGSGGATVAYLMDQLRSDLAPYGVDSLPSGFRFLHLDVPAVSDPGPDGLGNVEQLGGRYLGTGPGDASYPILDAALTQRLIRAQALDVTATWAPRDPEDVGIPIAEGAGQYRAVGRMITLSRVAEVLDVLRAEWDALHLAETTTRMATLRDRTYQRPIPGLGDYDDGTPLVLVVSSMAGGAGASMALDVCRLLTLVAGVDPHLIGVFMVTPTIFDGLPSASRPGVRPNALAMFGEIIATQTGAARAHDVRALRALGLHGGDGERVPFQRVFPVGSHIGTDRVRFGDGSAQAVYRGLGRGLAGLLMSGELTDQFVSYDLVTPVALPGDRDLLGWGCGWGSLPWGSYGFATLNMGRDRYVEYAAQRLSSGCIDHLLRGHLVPGDPTPAVEQVRKLVDRQLPEVITRVGLLPGHPGRDLTADATDWLDTVAFPANAISGTWRTIADEVVRPAVPDPTGMPVAQWEPAVRARVGDRRADLRRRLDDAVTALAYAWHEELARRTRDMVVAAVRRNGLAYAGALVEELGGHVRSVAAPAVRSVATQQAPEPAALPVELQRSLAGIRGAVARGEELHARTVAAYADQLRMCLYLQLSGVVHGLLLEYAAELVGPLRAALADAQYELERSCTAPVSDEGRALLATNRPRAWPPAGDAPVPPRFDHADNEVLLTGSADFLQQFARDVRHLTGTGTGGTGFADLIGDIVTGEWATTGGQRPPRDLLEELTPWRSAAFTTDPTGRPLVATRARFDVRVRPAELLARARQFVARPGEAFQQFRSVSIRSYLLDPTVTAGERVRRQEEIVAKFRETLSLARPLISVNSTALQEVHGARVQYRYKFSALPLHGLPVADELRRILEGDQDVDRSSLQTFTRSLAAGDDLTKIDVFGSYPNYSPLVFDAVLPPVAEQWEQAGDLELESLWRWRRSRPLTAALPLGDVERTAMVHGWFLAQIAGDLQLPESPFDLPVLIWDGDEREWVAFPHPLLTPPSRFLVDYDWLPAVLESVLLAMARSHRPPVMSSLRPYRLLRGVWDDNSQGPAAGIHRRSAEARAARWLAGHAHPGGGISRVPGADRATSAKERYAAVVQWLGPIADMIAERYLAPGQHGVPAGRSRALLQRRRDAARAPMFRDLAVDAHQAILELMALLEELVDTDDGFDDGPAWGPTF